jgi:hypothetical protein
MNTTASTQEMPWLDELENELVNFFNEIGVHPSKYSIDQATGSFEISADEFRKRNRPSRKLTKGEESIAQFLFLD